jgi:prepilin-type N-terminal cleavage/methylation domain-containing protein
MKTSRKSRSGFSLVEVLAAVAIIGIIVFIAIPNVIQSRRDAEEQFAITRAQALNIAVSQYVQAKGRANAGVTWAAKNNNERYVEIKPYLAYSPDALSGYTPFGYTFTFAGSPDGRVTVTRANGTATPDAIEY